jgi:hypothetical protein
MNEYEDQTGSIGSFYEFTMRIVLPRFKGVRHEGTGL